MHTHPALPDFETTWVAREFVAPCKLRAGEERDDLGVRGERREAPHIDL
ncbi:MAG: hypothetical protein O2816_00710 [Planctomycetota bacterium]|nr:hypothetical protein [Planctomycetota bacterium]